jgi:hypothetical protein
MCVLLLLAVSRAHQTALAVAALSSRHSEESGKTAAVAAVNIVRHSGLDELGWGEMEGQRQDIEPIRTDLRNLKAAW